MENSKLNSQLENLQNAANEINLTVKHKFAEDKRRTINKFFLINKSGVSVSPVLEYDKLNYFIFGWIKGLEHG